MNETPSTETALQTQGSQELAVGQFADDSGGTMVLPKLKISFGDSIGTTPGNPGDLVLDKTDCIAHKGDKLQVVIVNARTYWKEALPFGTPLEAVRQFNTREEVAAAGGRTSGWVVDPATGKSVGPNFREALTLDLLIRQPKGLISSMFCIPYGDDMYAPCRYYTDKDNAESLLTELRRAKFSLASRGLLAGVFDLWTVIKTYKNGNKTWISAMKLVGYNDDAFVKHIQTLLAGKKVEEKAEVTEEDVPFV